MQFHELRKVMGTSKLMILVPLFDLKSLGGVAAKVQGLQIGGTSGPIPTFASHCSEHFCECWNQRATSKILILVELWI